MGVPKGTINNPKGRGNVPGKATSQAREAIAAFVDGNADRLVGWLDQIAETNPKDAFNAFMSVVEYHIPKLQRQELTGKDGDAIETRDVTQADKELIERYIKQQTGQK